MVSRSDNRALPRAFARSQTFETSPVAQPAWEIQMTGPRLSLLATQMARSFPWTEAHVYSRRPLCGQKAATGRNSAGKKDGRTMIFMRKPCHPRQWPPVSFAFPGVHSRFVFLLCPCPPVEKLRARRCAFRLPHSTCPGQLMPPPDCPADSVPPPTAPSTPAPSLSRPAPPSGGSPRPDRPPPCRQSQFTSSEPRIFTRLFKLAIPFFPSLPRPFTSPNYQALRLGWIYAGSSPPYPRSLSRFQTNFRPKKPRQPLDRPPGPPDFQLFLMIKSLSLKNTCFPVGLDIFLQHCSLFIQLQMPAPQTSPSKTPSANWIAHQIVG